MAEFLGITRTTVSSTDFDNYEGTKYLNDGTNDIGMSPAARIKLCVPFRSIRNRSDSQLGKIEVKVITNMPDRYVQCSVDDFTTIFYPSGGVVTIPDLLAGDYILKARMINNADMTWGEGFFAGAPEDDCVSVPFTIYREYDYGVRWRLEFKDIHNDQGTLPISWTLDILEQKYEGAITEICGAGSPVQIEGQSDGVLSPIVSQRMTMNLIDQVGGTFNDIYGASPTKFIAKLYTAGRVHFQGYLVSYGYTEEQKAPPFFVTLYANDGFNRLEAIKTEYRNKLHPPVQFNDPDLNLYDWMYSELKRRLMWDFDIFIHNTFYHDTHDAPILKQTSCDALDITKGKTISLREFIARVADNFYMRVLFTGQAMWWQKKHSMDNVSGVKLFRSGDDFDTFTTPSLAGYKSELGCAGSLAALWFINNDFTKTYERACGLIRVFCDQKLYNKEEVHGLYVGQRLLSGSETKVVGGYGVGTIDEFNTIGEGVEYTITPEISPLSGYNSNSDQLIQVDYDTLTWHSGPFLYQTKPFTFALYDQTRVRFKINAAVNYNHGIDWTIYYCVFAGGKYYSALTDSWVNIVPSTTLADVRNEYVLKANSWDSQDTEMEITTSFLSSLNVANPSFVFRILRNGDTGPENIRLGGNKVELVYQKEFLSGQWEPLDESYTMELLDENDPDNPDGVEYELSICNPSEYSPYYYSYAYHHFPTNSQRASSVTVNSLSDDVTGALGSGKLQEYIIGHIKKQKESREMLDTTCQGLVRPERNITYDGKDYLITGFRADIKYRTNALNCMEVTDFTNSD